MASVIQIYVLAFANVNEGKQTNRAFKAPGCRLWRLQVTREIFTLAS